MVAGGWQLAGVVTLETGAPLNLGIGGGTQTICAVVSNCSVRPNLIGAISYPNTKVSLQNSPVGSVQWFSPSSFSDNLVPGAYIATFGSLGHNAVWGPGRDNWDLSLIKDFAFTERLRLELRVDAINVWNHVQWSGVDTGVGDANFGKTTAAYPGRDAQLGAKISW